MWPDVVVQGIAGAIVAALVLALVTLRQRWPGLSRKRLWTAVVAAAFAALPLVVAIPQDSARAVVAALALACAMKATQLQAGLVAPQTQASWWRFLLWLLVPPRTVWGPTPQIRGEARRQGLRRWGRALAKAALLVLLIQLQARQTWRWPLGVWAAAFEIYFIVSGLADLVTGLTSLLGFVTDEVFGAPFVARSPADFWGQRWNLFVSGFLRRFVFVPLARGGHVYRGAAAVFLVSGLAHEYFVFVSVERGAYEPGYMLSFFALQGAAVMGGAWWRAHLRPVRFSPAGVKVVAHLVWLAVTAPLFIWPIRTLLDNFEAPLRWWW